MGHELTNLFILAGTLFLLFIGCLALQLASTESGCDCYNADDIVRSWHLDMDVSDHDL